MHPRRHATQDGSCQRQRAVILRTPVELVPRAHIIPRTAFHRRPSRNRRFNERSIHRWTDHDRQPRATSDHVVGRLADLDLLALEFKLRGAPTEHRVGQRPRQTRDHLAPRLRTQRLELQGRYQIRVLGPTGERVNDLAYIVGRRVVEPRAAAQQRHDISRATRAAYLVADNQIRLARRRILGHGDRHRLRERILAVRLEGYCNRNLVARLHDRPIRRDVIDLDVVALRRQLDIQLDRRRAHGMEAVRAQRLDHTRDLGCRVRRPCRVEVGVLARDVDGLIGGHVELHLGGRVLRGRAGAIRGLGEHRSHEPAREHRVPDDPGVELRLFARRLVQHVYADRYQIGELAELPTNGPGPILDRHADRTVRHDQLLGPFQAREVVQHVPRHEHAVHRPDTRRRMAERQDVVPVAIG